MQIAPFGTEQFFALYEFSTPYLLCTSDCESMTVEELLVIAGIPLSQFGDLQLGYTESQGDLDLREMIAGIYQTLDPDHIVSLNAPEEGIYLTMRTLLERDDEVVVLTPAYDSLRHLVHHIVGENQVHHWTLQPTKTGWQLDFEQFRRLMARRPKLVIVNFPHNPTGFLPTQAELEQIVAECRQSNSWLFCDEMYRGLEVDGNVTLPSAGDLYDKAITLSGLSKLHGLPGLRVGWLTVQDELIRSALINWKHYTTICPPAPSEWLAKVALQAHAQLVQRNRAIVQGNLEVAEPFFVKWHSLFKWRRPQAGSVGLVEMRIADVHEYCESLAKRAGILLLPGSYLGAPSNSVRFGFGRKNFHHNLTQYDRWLQENQPPI